jgi:hypothetical protein
MAKKKQSKKHKFKYSEPTTELRPADSSLPTLKTGGNQTTVLRPPAGRMAAIQSRDFSYVLSDLKRIFVLGVSLVLAELLLWYLFGHTGLGSTVYNLVNV